MSNPTNNFSSDLDPYDRLAQMLDGGLFKLLPLPPSWANYVRAQYAQDPLLFSPPASTTPGFHKTFAPPRPVDLAPHGSPLSRPIDLTAPWVPTPLTEPPLALPTSDTPGFDKTPTIPGFRRLPQVRDVSPFALASGPIDATTDGVQQAFLPDNGSGGEGGGKRERCPLMPGSEQFGFCLYICPSGAIKRFDKSWFGCQPSIYSHDGV